MNKSTTKTVLLVMQQCMYIWICSLIMPMLTNKDSHKNLGVEKIEGYVPSNNENLTYHKQILTKPFKC